MDPTVPFTEIVFSLVKPGVDLNKGAAASPENEKFKGLVDIIKSQKGCKRTYWGHVVEKPELFIWATDWTNLGGQGEFTSSPDFQKVMGTAGEIFDYAKQPPTLVFSRWTEDPTAAFRSKATEIAFFELTSGKGEEAHAKIREAIGPVNEAVVKFGNATGTGGGLSQKLLGFEGGLQFGDDLLTGIYGYESVDAHNKWREHPEHSKIEKGFEALHKNGVGLSPADLPGVDPKTGFFHVHFEEAQ